jgi:large subunit ribosomal protein L33
LGERKHITLACEVCGARNYKTSKSPKAQAGERLRMKKFCSACATHTWHAETK